jgi:hypothetical protein
MADEQRYIVWMPTAPGWSLEATANGPVTSGGHRTLHELAVAMAATGRRVEVRGQFDLAELSYLSQAAGAMPELPAAPRRPGHGDVVLMPEGFEDPLTFAYVALSEARRILLLLAPPGLFGWPFVKGWSKQAAVDVAIESVALPNHFRAMAGMGFELWTNSPAMADRIEAAGLRGTFIGSGRSVPWPEPLPKRYDVVTLANNRWADLARWVVSRLEPGVVHHEIPAASNDEVLRQLGQARVLIHPSCVEGHSRIGEEARAMGAVPVVLSTNQFSLGLDEEGGAVAVPSLDDMPQAVMSLLGDAERWVALRERSMKAARAQVDWDAYLARVDAALSRPPEEGPALGGWGLIGERLMQEEARIVRDAAAKEDTLKAELLRVDGELARTHRENDAFADELESERAAICSMQRTRAWSVAGRYWRARARAAHISAWLRVRWPMR